MGRQLLLLTLAVGLATAQYGPIKQKGPKRTTTPFPPQEPDYSGESNELDSGNLAGAYPQPSAPGSPGAVAQPDNPWLSGVIGGNVPPPSQSRPAYPSQPAQPSTTPCNTPGYVCAPRNQCAGGQTSSPGTGSTQCDAATQVCCQKQQPQQYQPQPQQYQPQPQPYQPQPQPYQPQPQQQQYRPQPQLQQPVPAPAPAPQFRPQPQQQPAYQPQPNQPRPYQQQGPIGGSIYDSQPPPQQFRPQPNNYNPYATESPVQRYTGPQNVTPHPGCPAALKCVEEIYCTWDGVMSDTPQAISRDQIEDKVPLSDCQNVETGIIGKCCRDPNYKDPWPAGMMMGPSGPSGPSGFDDGHYHPGAKTGPAPNQGFPSQPSFSAPQPQYQPQQPQFQQQPQPQYTPNSPPFPAPAQQQPGFSARPKGTERGSCGPTASCTPQNLCPGDRLTQPGKVCRVPNDDSTGVCCTKAGYPQNTNNQQSRPLPKQTNPYGAPQPRPTATPQPPSFNQLPSQNKPYQSAPQPNPYNRPQAQPRPQPTPYNQPQAQPKSQPNPYNQPQPSAPQPSPYNQPQPSAPQPNPYNQRQPSAPQPSPYNQPQPSAPQPNPYNRPQSQPKPQPNPFNQPPAQPKPQPNPYNQPQSSAPQPNPYNRPQPSAPQPNPYNRPQVQPKPAPEPNPFSQPQPNPAPNSDPFYSPQPNKPSPQNNPYYGPSKPQPQVNPYYQTKPQPSPYNQVTPQEKPAPNPYQPAPQPNPYKPPTPQPNPYQPPQTTAAPEPSQPEPTAAAPAPKADLPEPTKPEASNDVNPEVSTPSSTTPEATSPPPVLRPKDATPEATTPEPGKECGVRRDVPRPNGPAGLDTGFGEFPWQAQVLRSEDQSPLCSAAILAENIMVTAAHCVDQKSPGSIKVKAGDWKLGSENPSEEPKPVQIKDVAAIVTHPQYDPITLQNDMAVIIMDSPLTFDQHVDKVCLGSQAPAGQPPAGKNCVVTGWGKDATRGNTPGSTMHSIPVSFMPNQQCQDAFKKTHLGKYFQLHSSFTCALPNSPNHDLCQVDAGSPITCQKPDGKYELSGIYSWDAGCHPNTNVPVAMSKVDDEFIKSVMDKPLDEIQKETDAEKQRQSELGQAGEEVQASKPGFSQGYGR